MSIVSKKRMTQNTWLKNVRYTIEIPCVYIVALNNTQTTYYGKSLRNICQLMHAAKNMCVYVGRDRSGVSARQTRPMDSQN